MQNVAHDNNRNGQSVLEVILASAIFVIVAVPLIGILLQSFQTDRVSNEATIATQYAAEGLDAARDIRNRSYALLASSTGEGVATTTGVWGWSGTSTAAFGSFTRVMAVAAVYRDGSGNIVASGGTLDPNTMKVISTVSWGSTHSVALSTYLTNWRASYSGSIVATSLSGLADGTSPKDRSFWRASDGSLILFYQDGQGHIDYVTSTNGGSIWSSPAPIVYMDSYSVYAFSSYMDPSNNVYMTYMSNRISQYVFEVKLTYNGSGSWSLGTINTVDNTTGVQNTGPDAYPSIIKNASGTLWTTYSIYSSASSTFTLAAKNSSDDGATWSLSTPLDTSSGDFLSALALYNNYPVVSYFNNGNIFFRGYNGSSWSSIATVDGAGLYDASFSTAKIGSNILYVGAKKSYGNMQYSVFNGSTWSTIAYISTDSNDTYFPNVVTDGTNAWVLYSHYNGTGNSYDIYERKWNGTAWDSTGTPLTTSGNQNLYAQMPMSITAGGTIPYVYMSGTTSPYTINYNTFSTP